MRTMSIEAQKAANGGGTASSSSQNYKKLRYYLCT